MKHKETQTRKASIIGNTKISGFDWDKGNIEKCQKHGVTIVEIEFALIHEPRIAPDIKHSVSEQRFLAIGKNKKGRYIFIAFMFRRKNGEFFLRPISARYMHKKEIEHYEKEST